MRDEYKELKADVLDEEKLIEETLQRLTETRAKFDPQNRGYLVEPAMGTYLMNFYSGVEKIIKRIVRGYYLTMPKGESWHRELLVLSSNPPEGKIPIFSQDIVARLHPYRNFRHRFISGYGAMLNGEKMLSLIDNVNKLWADIKKSISGFFDKV